ncbi:hypothetical protein CEUSTIGMA_g1214.t1 [Chlamydomonas eustigma]|uniref:MAGE domain-containing protein n=1 Tax=Chlamydomonas eustigma TaxID=1157962 RepID=A0A250WSF3_9CHLO|nr:hypothetical protein CEUSTIGMA_g1214.t1 [Chlamydomonas eustigma]|eukprot:GAX73763.1 hypothetical protein CEUSTIGMA_g1214.t1 [Chlamydomonas eustigma]
MQRTKVGGHSASITKRVRVIVEDDDVLEVIDCGPSSSKKTISAGQSLNEFSRRTTVRSGGNVEFGAAELTRMAQKVSKYEENMKSQESARERALTQMELNSMTGKIVRHMIFSNHERPGEPVSRQKLHDALLADYKNHKHSKALLNLVLPMAQYKLISVFGMEMRELEKAGGERKGKAGSVEGGGAAAPSATGAKMYVLRNILPIALREEVLPERISQSLLLVVLAILYLAQGSMDESQLRKWLSQLGIRTEGEEAAGHHPKLGNIKEELQRMAKCRYLILTKKSMGVEGIVDHTVEWGEAAKDEVSESEIKDFIEKVFSEQKVRQVLNSNVERPDEEITMRGPSQSRGVRSTPIPDADVIEIVDSDE